MHTTNIKCAMCDSRLRYSENINQYNSFLVKLFCSNHIVPVLHNYKKDQVYFANNKQYYCVEYFINEINYSISYNLSCTSIIKNTFSYFMEQLFFSNSVIIISPESLEKKLPLLTTFK